MAVASAGFKTTLYYSPEGACEAAYVEFSARRAVRREEPDPRYVISVYFDAHDEPIGVRISERVPESVLTAALKMIIDATPQLIRPLADAREAIGTAA